MWTVESPCQFLQKSLLGVWFGLYWIFSLRHFNNIGVFQPMNKVHTSIYLGLSKFLSASFSVFSVKVLHYFGVRLISIFHIFYILSMALFLKFVFLTFHCYYTEIQLIFCILILYPPILINSLITSRSQSNHLTVKQWTSKEI